MNSDDIAQLLTEGWTIEGYATDMMAQGALVHSVLLRNGSGLKSISIVTMQGKELGRSAATLSPKPIDQPKKGFFG